MASSQRPGPGPAASDIVAACELAWRSFRRHHPDLPEAVIVLGSGVDRGRLVKLGHWWGARWEAGGEHRGEVLLAGEALHLPVEQVFEVLLHEAAHGINAAREVKDTSRGGRYHNARFQATAIEVGLLVEQQRPYGWANTSLGPEATQRYATEIAELSEAMRIARRVDTRSAAGVSEGSTGTTKGGGARGSQSTALTCGCGRRVRMAPSVAAKGPVLCGLCNEAFAEPGAETRPANRDTDLARAGPEAPVLEGLADLMDRARRWALSHGQRLDEPLLASDADEVEVLNGLARAARRELGQLPGPDLDTGSLVLAPGDQVVVASPPPLGGPELPEVGVVGQVMAVEIGTKRVTVDFPIAGRFHLDADSAGQHLTYGYATTKPDASLPLPVTTPERHNTPSVETPEPLAEVIQLDLGLP